MKRHPLFPAMLMLFLASCANTPEAVDPVPTMQQLEWQQLETYAFIHFGLNTFNDMEWGYGDTPASTFNPTDLDCEQWVLTLKAAGMKGVIFTAKHHDGFCLWPTKSTDYSIMNSPYQNGKGDVVGELCEACRKHGLKFGLYLSPWDRHHADYGREEYVKTYHQQIQELVDHYGPFFEFWFDGANGGDGWYGGAKEKRAIKAEEYYDYQTAKSRILAKSPDAMIFGGTVPTIRWIGNEEGRAAATQWCRYSLDFEKLNDTKLLATGIPTGEVWLPAEVDVSIRPGWFYHEREDAQVKTVDQLMELYYSSVGRNANLLLNVPVNSKGKISSIDSATLVAWRAKIEESFQKDVLQQCKVMASNARGSRYMAENVLNEDVCRYWSTEDGVTRAELVFHFPEPTQLNTLMLQEYLPLGQRVKGFSLFYATQNEHWLPVETDEPMTTIGYKRIIRFQPIKANYLKVRFHVDDSPISIQKVTAFDVR